MLKKKLAKLEADAVKGDELAENEAIRLATELADFNPTRAVQLFSDDCTSEKLPRLLAEQNELFSIISSEGGILSTIAGRYSGEVNADVYLKSFYGEAVQVDRVNRESDTLSNSILGVILCIQPVILKKLIENSELKGNGLVDRFIYCCPPSSIGKSRFNTPFVNGKIKYTDFRQ